MVKSFDEFPGLKRIWNATFLALSEAKSILFFGFSFPSSDALINEVLRSAFAKNVRDIDISIVDIAPDKPAAILSDMLSPDDGSVIRLYQVPTDREQPDWLATDSSLDAESVQ
jgi:hypothetical protein